MRTTNAAQAADRLQEILQFQPDSLAALSEVEPLLEPSSTKPSGLTEAPSVFQNEPSAALQRLLQLPGVPDLVADALDVYGMALEQAETARLALWRIIHAADLQQHAV